MTDLPTLYHLVAAEEWDPDATEPYALSTIGLTLEDVGFIHLSLARQVRATAARFFGDREVVLLRIDPGLLGARVEFEPSADSDDVFPHLYGPIPRAAILAADPVRRDPDGRHDFTGLLTDTV